MSYTAPDSVEPQVDPCVLTQRQIRERAINHLTALKAKIFHPVFDYLGEVTIGENELASLGIRKICPLDVDETAPFDPDPLFFKPCPIGEDEDLPALVHGSLRHDQTQVKCKWNTSAWKPECQLEEQNCSPDGIIHHYGHHTLHRATWFMCVLGCSQTGILVKRSPWKYRVGDSTTDDYEWPDKYCRYEGDYRHAWRSDEYFEIRETSPDHPRKPLPHLGTMVCDTTKQCHETLTSEVVAALSMILQRLTGRDYHEKYADCHTIPVLVYSIHHDAFARVTQVHWDGNGLILRQSRLLDLRGPNPTSDAYLLVRWMANTPVGVTAYERLEDPTVSTSPETRTSEAESMMYSKSISVEA